MHVQLTPLLVFVIFSPLAGGMIVPFLRKQVPSRQAIVPIISSAISFCLLLPLIPVALDGKLLTTPGLVFSPNMAFYLRADAMGILFAVVASLVWLMAAIFSYGYLKSTSHATRYFSLFSACLGFTLGVLLAGNLFTLFVFYELLTVGSYPLIAHEETPLAKKAARKYIVYTLIGDAFVLFTVLLTSYLSQNMNLHQGGLIPLDTSSEMVHILFICGLLGFGVKAAVMPLHGWVADAHPAAPAPASAVLSGVLVKVGVYGILRLIYDIVGVQLMQKFELSSILATPAMITIIFASVLAFNQDNIKRRLAYSTIAQLSYILLGAALLAPIALQGSLVHIAHHGIMKATLFLCAGAIIKYSGKEKISQMQGLSSQIPIVMGIFSLAALSLIGVPPLCGFISKWLLCTGALKVPSTMSVVVLLLGSLLSALYLLPIIYTAYFQKSDLIPTNPVKPAMSIMIPLFIGGLLCVLMGILVDLPYFPLSFAKVISSSFFGL